MNQVLMFIFTQIYSAAPTQTEVEIRQLQQDPNFNLELVQACLSKADDPKLNFNAAYDMRRVCIRAEKKRLGWRR